ncbi:MAG: ABC transporter ATP-binding protein, partial [Acidobacteria bacterium]|nr:ABC transporter ATP-binding protein [Acidobacteriota bacterium]
MLEAKEISIGYGAREVIAGVSLSARQASLTAIIGPNGAGKSTLMRALNGAKKISSGLVLLDGEPLNRFARRVIGRRIG